jgi:hypothetical protein
MLTEILKIQLTFNFITLNHNSRVSMPAWQWTMGWMASVQFLAKARDFLYSTASSPALGPTQPPIQ